MSKSRNDSDEEYFDEQLQLLIWLYFSLKRLLPDASQLLQKKKNKDLVCKLTCTAKWTRWNNTIIL